MQQEGGHRDREVCGGQQEGHGGVGDEGGGGTGSTKY